jgi:hypothetical protein
VTLVQRFAAVGLVLEGNALLEKGREVGRIMGDSVRLRGRVFLPLCGRSGVERAIDCERIAFSS